MPTEYVARAPWSSERPHALVVCCSDGRWHAQVQEYIAGEISDRCDLYAVPGGPAAFDPWSSSFDAARMLEQALQLFVAHHDLRIVWLIAHEGCVHYKLRQPNASDGELRQRQLGDLVRARAWLAERHPQLAVREVYASLRESRVTFTVVGAADSISSAG